MKRAVEDGYHLKTRPLYPRWQIRVKCLFDFMEDVDSLIIRVDHIFRHDGQSWEQLTCDGVLGDSSRLELARVAAALRSSILAKKKELA